MIYTLLKRFTQTTTLLSTPIPTAAVAAAVKTRRKRNKYFYAIITHSNTLVDMKKCNHRCNPILWIDWWWWCCCCVYSLVLFCSVLVCSLALIKLLKYISVFEPLLKWRDNGKRQMLCVINALTHVLCLHAVPFENFIERLYAQKCVCVCVCVHLCTTVVHWSHVKNNRGVKFSEF